MRRRAAGFTLIELMVVILIVVVGFLAMVHLQAGILKATANSWDMVAATHLGGHLLETIRLESLGWTAANPPSNPGFRYLNDLPTPSVAGAASDWKRAYLQGAGAQGSFQMVNQAGRVFGTPPEYDTGIVNGATGSLNAGVFPDNRNQRFCVRYRLTWLLVDTLFRADVRVYWPRDVGEGSIALGSLQTAIFDSCPMGGQFELDNHPDQLNQVTLTTTVIRNVFASPTP